MDSSRALPAEVVLVSNETSRKSTLRRSLAKGHLAVYQVLLLLAMMLLWEFNSYYFDMEFWISSPSAILRSLAKWHATGMLWSDLQITLLEASVGFLVGAVVGAVFGFLLGWVRALGDLLEPFVLSLYTVPKIALAPLFILWFGIGPFNKMMFSAMLVAMMVFITTFQGVRQVDRDLVANVVLLGARPFQTWTKIAIPYAAVWIFTGLRIGLPYALIGAIVGEFIAADRGVGYRIKEATSFFDTSAVFAGILVLMFISTILLMCLRVVERHVLRWQTVDLSATRQE